MNTAISATASGSISPQTASFPATVTNGDFLISPNPNCTPQTCPLTGDGFDDITTWTFDFTKDPGFASFSTSKPLASTLLTLTLTPKHSLVATDTVRIEPLVDIVAPVIQSLPVDQTSTIQLELLDFYSSADILGVLSANGGLIPMSYQDDAIIASARLDLSNTVPAFQHELSCDNEARRAQVIAHATLNGIDYVEVSAASLNEQRFVHVFFLKAPPPAGLVDHPELFQIEGGVRTPNIKVLQVSQLDEHLVVEVDQAGDFSTYRLLINSATLDPIYAQVEFSFKAGCPSRFDCRPRVICPPEPRAEPLIDYLAKDYASFRQALIDLISTLVPDWKERHEADLGIALVELLAYVGDQLSYYQDAVANEAYLETARQRISVRRHARLIDYRMHDGASARTFIHLTLSPSAVGRLPAGAIQVLTRIGVPLGQNQPPHPAVIPADLRDRALSAADAVFETITWVRLDSDLNEIKIHTWGNEQCCLPRGTTTVDLVGHLAGDPTTTPPTPPILEPGDFLLFEEVKGVRTGLKEDADPAHRQVVRLKKVKRADDPLLGVALTRVTWERADALTFPLCLSIKLDDPFVK